MTSKYYQYAVYSSGVMLAGRLTFDSQASVQQATDAAVHEAKTLAADDGNPFDHANLSVAVKPVSRHTPIDSSTQWEVPK
jgi:hypothetical protein